MTAPRDFDYQQGRPEIEHLRESSATPRDGRDPPEQPCGAEIESEPEQLGLEDRAAGQRDCEERELRQRRIDGRHGRIVDQSFIDGADLRQLTRGGGIPVGVDARELHLAVPQVPIDVIGQLGCERQQDQAHRDGDSPDVEAPAPGLQYLARSYGIGSERSTEYQQPHPWECCAWPPPEGPQQCQFYAPGDDQHAPGLRRVGAR